LKAKIIDCATYVIYVVVKNISLSYTLRLTRILFSSVSSKTLCVGGWLEAPEFKNPRSASPWDYFVLGIPGSCLVPSGGLGGAS
jgi:hypothetical protein